MLPRCSVGAPLNGWSPFPGCLNRESLRAGRVICRLQSTPVFAILSVELESASWQCSRQKEARRKEAGEGRADRCCRWRASPLPCRFSVARSVCRHITESQYQMTPPFQYLFEKPCKCDLQLSLACHQALSEVDDVHQKRLSCLSHQESTLVTRSQYLKGSNNTRGSTASQQQ